MNEKTDIEDKCYVLPLAPQDLVGIYKHKETVEDFTLWVDYLISKEKLSAKHIIIYLANTNFRASFAQIDDDLIREYIKSDFMVDCPLLARIVVLIVKHYYRHEPNEQERELYSIFSPANINIFIRDNNDLVKELVRTIASAVPFVLNKFYDGLDEEGKEKEINVREFVNDITIADKPSNCGPNIARLLTVGFDAFLLIIQKEGLSMEYNKQVYNDAPKFLGKDLYFIFCNTKITDHIMDFFPDDWIKSYDSTSE